jgi:hypothetical protein
MSNFWSLDPGEKYIQGTRKISQKNAAVHLHQENDYYIWWYSEGVINGKMNKTIPGKYTSVALSITNRKYTD